MSQALALDVAAVKRKEQSAKYFRDLRAVDLFNLFYPPPRS